MRCIRNRREPNDTLRHHERGQGGITGLGGPGLDGKGRARYVHRRLPDRHLERPPPGFDVEMSCSLQVYRPGTPGK
jgi:hypothetical protein